MATLYCETLLIRQPYRLEKFVLNGSLSSLIYIKIEQKCRLLGGLIVEDVLTNEVSFKQGSTVYIFISFQMRSFWPYGNLANV